MDEGYMLMGFGIKYIDEIPRKKLGKAAKTATAGA